MAEAYRTSNGVLLLLAILPPLQRIASLLELELHNSQRDLLVFYRYFNSCCELLLLNLIRVNRIEPADDLEQCASRVLERFEGLLSYSNVPLIEASVSL
jgi:hypothetical protein